jgi:hypothetical protein
LKTGTPQDSWTPVFKAALFTTAEVEATQVSNKGHLNKQNVVYITMSYLKFCQFKHTNKQIQNLNHP